MQKSAHGQSRLQDAPPGVKSLWRVATAWDRPGVRLASAGAHSGTQRARPAHHWPGSHGQPATPATARPATG